jgi:hypothetical protein
MQRYSRQGPRRLRRLKLSGLVLAGLLSSFLLGCAAGLAVPVMPPCPSPSWAMIDELEEACGFDEVPFVECPALYNYLEDVERYCEEIEALRD